MGSMCEQFFRFNRTFMELKSLKSRLSGRQMSFNRTFMELKFNAAGTHGAKPAVLIVPLWN